MQNYIVIENRGKFSRMMYFWFVVSQTLKEAVSAYLKLSSSAMAKLEQLAVSESFQKGDFVTREGRTNSKEYLVLNGICRTCIYGPEGEDTTLSFYVPGSVLTPFVVRVNKGQSVLNIQASTDLQVISFDASQFEQLMVEDLEIRAFGNEVLKTELVAMFNKQLGLGSHTAKDRLIAFRQDYPQLENLIPHAEIASYLGITTISLSRLRKELMH